MSAADALNFARASWDGFLIRAVHEQYIVDVRPVGANGICRGRTGGPTAHSTFGEDGYRVGGESWRNAAASVCGVERAQGGLPFLESAQGWMGAGSSWALATDACDLLPARRVSVDRRHQRTGLQLSSGDRGVGVDRQWAGSGDAAPQHFGGAGGPVGRRAAAGGNGGWVAGPAVLAAPRAAQTREGDVAAAGEPAPGVAAVGGRVGAGRRAAGWEPLDLCGGPGSGFLRADRALPAARDGFCIAGLSGSGAGRARRSICGRRCGKPRCWGRC